MTGRDGEPLRVAVIGAGWAARSIWLPRLTAHPAFTVVAIVDPDPTARASAGRVREFESAEELSADEIDLAVVAVPNHLHAAVTETLLRAGIPAFVEKPVCLTSAEAERLAKTEAAAGTVLLAGSAARYRADVRRFIDLAGTVGDIRHVELGWVRAQGIPSGAGWFTRRELSGGGALVDLGWHLLDVVTPLLGKATFRHVVGAVSDDFLRDGSARASWRLDETAHTQGDVEDTARGFLVTEDGTSVSLTAGWASHRATDVTTLVVEGSAGAVTLVCTFGFSPARQEHSTLTVTRKGEKTVVPVPNEPVGAEYDRLLDALPRMRNDAAGPGAAIGETARHIEVVERLYASAREVSVRSSAPSPSRRASALKTVVFDLDGVLVDSFAVMRQAFTCAYREVVGAGEPPFEEYNQHLGRYFPDIMRIMGLPLEMEKPFVRESSRLAGQVTLFPGVEELLHLLREHGIKTAVATGKAGWRARELLERLGVLDMFDHVVGSDEVRRPKPAPDIVLRALDLLDADREGAVMLGDAVTDLTAARHAGVVAIAALWGESNEAALLAENPDVVLRRPADLARLVVPTESSGQRVGTDGQRVTSPSPSRTHS